MRLSPVQAPVLSLLVLLALACSNGADSPAKAGGGSAPKPAAGAPKEDPEAGKALLDEALAKAREQETRVLLEYYDPT